MSECGEERPSGLSGRGAAYRVTTLPSGPVGALQCAPLPPQATVPGGVGGRSLRVASWQASGTRTLSHYWRSLIPAPCL